LPGFIVAELNEKTGQYYAPMTEKRSKQTGCNAYTSGNIETLCAESYKRKQSARKFLESLDD
jgi:hypothetical protein